MKQYRKLLSSLAVLLLFSTIVGCDNSDKIATIDELAPPIVVDDSQVVEVDNSKVESEVVDEMEQGVAPIIEEETGDPELAALEVTEEFAMENGLICLYRKGKLYSLGRYIPEQSTYDYQIGHTVDDFRSELMMLHPRTNEDTVATYGDAPEVILTDGDELRVYNDFHGLLIPLEYIGYTIPVIWTNDNVGFLEYYNHVQHTLIKKEYTDSIEIRDSGDNLITDGQYQKMAIYTMSWYEANEYHEVELWADCREYSYSQDRVDADSEKTKDGYILIKWTGLPSGCYMIDNSGYGLPFTIE